MADPLSTLTEAGVSIWLDDLSRERLTSGSLAALVERRHVTGVTTNPSIFAKATTSGRAYDDQVVDLAAREAMPEATLRAVADHGEVPADSTHGTYEGAQQVLDRLADVGVDYGDVVTHLEDEGVGKFDAAWDHLGEQLAISLAASGRRPA